MPGSGSVAAPHAKVSFIVPIPQGKQRRTFNPKHFNSPRVITMEFAGTTGTVTGLAFDQEMFKQFLRKRKKKKKECISAVKSLPPSTTEACFKFNFLRIRK